MVDRPRKWFIGTHFRGRLNRDADPPPPADGSRKSSTAAAQVANHLPTVKNKPKEKTGSFIWPQRVRRLSPMVTQRSLSLQPRPQVKLTPLICMRAICATSTARDASAGHLSSSGSRAGNLSRCRVTHSRRLLRRWRRPNHRL